MDFASAAKHRLSLLAVFSLLILTNAKLHVHQSDSDAYMIIKKHLGINDQHQILHNRPSVVWTITNRINNTSVLRITRIVLKSEGLAGFLSPEIGRLSELRELSLQNNNLVDQLPPQIVDCKKLEILNLHNNKFSGKITPELSSLNRLRILDLSSNKFSGDLTFLKYFPNLEILSLADNQFSGKIPYSIRSFRNLRFANFSGNPLENSVQLSTHVDFSASEFQKRYRLAENSSRGFGINKNISPAVAPTASKGGSTAPSPASTPNKKKKSKKNKTRGWILGFLAGALAGCVSGLICSLLFKLLLGIVKGRKEKFGLEIYSQAIKKTDLAFLEKEDGLASLEIIGRGGCGEVYRAELPDCNIKTIAVKKIIQLPKEAVAELNEEDSKALGKKMRQIRSEIQTVGKVRHRNLLPLLAHLSRPDCHCLVYEYMKNGSLRDLLNDVARGTKELNWLARHKIALGVACGLEYLHIEQRPHIIHRDLKPENILLDDDMEARIADFGLAKAIPDGNTHMSTSNVAGTWGYIAPEYYQTVKFTTKCDIYSFGVILGVLVIGKLPSDEFFVQSDDIGIVKWMRNVMASENPREAIDPMLLGTGHEEQILLMLKIAYFCTVDDPKQRPNSKDVKVMLSQIPH